MKNKVLNIAVLSTCSKPGDIDANLNQIHEYARAAHGYGCNVMLTPELSASGYGGYPEVLASAEEAGKGGIYRRLAQISAECEMVLMAGFAEKSEDKTYLSHYIVYPNGNFELQRKNRVTPLEAPLCPARPLYFDDTEEIGHIDAKDAYLNFFSINGVKCAVAICADVGIKNLQAFLDENGVEALFVPVGAGGKRENKITNAELKTAEGKQKYISLCDNEYFFPRGSITDALNHSRAMIAVNMCGFDGKSLYHGGSGSVVNHFGEIVAMAAGIENLDRQRPRMAFGEIDFNETL